MTDSDSEAVLRIYSEGVATGIATFDTAVPDWEVWDAEHLGECRLVAEVEGAVVGWAALSPVSERCVYEGVGEVSVYVSEDARGRGIGSRLLNELVAASEGAGLWTLQAGILPANEGSITLHLRSGFRQVGVRERLGAVNGQWHDVILLERRSATVGI